MNKFIENNPWFIGVLVVVGGIIIVLVAPWVIAFLDFNFDTAIAWSKSMKAVRP